MKKVLGVAGNPNGHWVGDGFPVRTLFSYDQLGEHLSPFLLFDYAGPHRFAPSPRPRGVGQHPHRGFETVTIVYDGEVEHRDSTGQGGVIGPGDVQWMTAASGILHAEFHSPRYSAAGGPFRMVQLWVNLPAKDKMAAPGYQPILDADIPVAHLPGGGRVRVIAGDLQGVRGPARTFTPINLWDLRLAAGEAARFELPDGHTAAVAVLAGPARVNGQAAGEASVVLLERAGREVVVEAEGEAMLLVMSGEPLDEPIAGAGPFVMNTEAEIRQAYADFRSGRFGQLADA
jgi:redox-sensitive bicupin YhaK (pirin superfamily)